jgi:biopolymer transport protein ExbB/TolQ
VVAPGIAEALFATGLGLLAAIPALIFYNKLTADSDGIVGRLGGLCRRVRHHPQPPAGQLTWAAT